MLILFGVVVVGFILGLTYIEQERNATQKRQAELERENDILKRRIKEEEVRQHKEMLSKEYNPQV